MLAADVVVLDGDVAGGMAADDGARTREGHPLRGAPVEADFERTGVGHGIP
jgi:hypothetical protein